MSPQTQIYSESRPATRTPSWWRTLLRPTARSWPTLGGAHTLSPPRSEPHTHRHFLLRGNTRILLLSSDLRPASLLWWLCSRSEVTPPSFGCLRPSAGTLWAICCPTWTWTTTTSRRRGPAPRRPPPPWRPCRAESRGLMDCREACKDSEEAYKDFMEGFKDSKGGFRDYKGGFKGFKEGYRGFRGSMDWGDSSPAVASRQPSPCWVGAPPSRPGLYLEESNRLWRALKQELCLKQTSCLYASVFTARNAARSRDLIPLKSSTRVESAAKASQGQFPDVALWAKAATYSAAGSAWGHGEEITEMPWCCMEANWVKALFEPRRRREEEAVKRYKHSCFSTFHLYLPLPASPSRSARPSSRLSATEQPIVPVCCCHGARELSVAHDDLSSFICSDFIYFSSMFAACPLLKDP